ncbi:hypothetical protein [Clostridium ganghwense]|uniref:Uncharacterized protein n=1 Tax=Clostridium ganghwense TaxID=312089 RepID=A0ABT4CN24_9CLOT|nr:hypothetical protein [Clostridium ganghwense]MCY6369496.1 hypothetical protein [Clostridium ganghwense]
MVSELKLIQLEKISFAIGIVAFIILIQAANREIQILLNKEHEVEEESSDEEEEVEEELSSEKEEENFAEKEVEALTITGNRLLVLERLISALVATIGFKEEKNKLKSEGDIKSLELDYRIVIGSWIVVLGTILITNALEEKECGCY